MRGSWTSFVLLSAIVVALGISSCAITRTETDYYTITDRDTLVTERVRNVPGEENGVVYPSSREVEMHRNFMTHDSTYDRRYPAFLRLGGIEIAGLIGTSTEPGIGGGIFGLYDFLTIDSNWRGVQNPGNRTRPNSIFKGMLFRFLPYEYQLHWFNDAPGWTYGGSAVEVLAKDEKNVLTSVGLNTYARRRFYLRDKIPYVIFAPFIGISAAPSAYVNIGGELQFGSYGGFSLRAYGGMASGFNWSSPTKSITFPYFGLGVCTLDFTNKVEETQHEWKDYVHSAVEVEGMEVQVMRSRSYLGLLDTSTTNLPIQSLALRIGTAHFPLPILDHHFWAGTSLLSYLAMGATQQGLSVLPVRVGYRDYLVSPDLMLEPFVEYNYYPSSWLNIGARVKLNVFVGMSLIGGYITGSAGHFLPKSLNDLGSAFGTDFSSAYLGIAVSLFDHLHSPEEIDAMHAREVATP